MTPQRALNFVPSAQAWLFGHAAGPWLRGLVCALLTGAALLLAAGAAASAMQRQALAAQREAAAMRPRSAAAAKAAAGAAAAAATPVLSAADLTRINRVVRSLNTPWAQIFQALEAQSSPHVAVLALDSDADQGAVRVLTEGPSLDRLLAHAQQLQNATPFVRTQLLRIEAPDSLQRPALPAAQAGQALPIVLSRLAFDVTFVP